MSKITSVSNKNLYTKPVTQPVIQPSVKQNSEISNNKKVAFGMGFPDEEELAHQINEVLSVESLEKGLAIYLEALNLLGDL